VGWGRLNRDPRYTEEWSWKAATYTDDVNPEVYLYHNYLRVVDLGEFSFAFRFSLDNGYSYTYSQLGLLENPA